jgi:hypothetical protein
MSLYAFYYVLLCLIKLQNSEFVTDCNICDVPYGSRYMKSVNYHAPKTVLENFDVIFGL